MGTYELKRGLCKHHLVAYFFGFHSVRKVDCGKTVSRLLLTLVVFVHLRLCDTITVRLRCGYPAIFLLMTIELDTAATICFLLFLWRRGSGVFSISVCAVQSVWRKTNQLLNLEKCCYCVHFISWEYKLNLQLCHQIILVKQCDLICFKITINRETFVKLEHKKEQSFTGKFHPAFPLEAPNHQVEPTALPQIAALSWPLLHHHPSLVAAPVQTPAWVSSWVCVPIDAFLRTTTGKH